MTKQQGIGIVIDFGEITAGLSAARGMANGFTKRQRLAKSVERIAKLGEADFGRMTDQLGDEHLAHVYEYRSSQDNTVNASPAGRLWGLNHRRINGGVVVTPDLSKKSTVFAGPDPRLAGETKATHQFAEKASHLETRQYLTARAGVQEHTVRKGEGQPRTLVFLSGNTVQFRAWRQWRNEFYGRFGEHFREYWQKEIFTATSSNAKRFTSVAGRSMSGVGKAEVAAARAKSIPHPSRGVPGRTIALDQGKPFTGIREHKHIVARVEKKVQNMVQKALVKAWRR